MIRRPPILIIINLIILSYVYLYWFYQASGALFDEMLRGRAVIIYFIPLIFVTLCMIGTYIVVIKRHARSILLLGVVLSLSLILLIPGMVFIIWSIYLFGSSSNSQENIPIKKQGKYKCWLYSALAFCVAGILSDILSIYLENQAQIYESLQRTTYIIMCVFLIVGILQLVIYYILSKKIDFRENEMNSPEKS